jgi:Flp pilus assembly pilin Flp
MNFFRNNRGATAVEFALVALPLMAFIIGIIQFGWIIWVDNLLHISVDTASRCGAIGSVTSPCGGAGPVNSGSIANMITTANTVFQPLCCTDQQPGAVGPRSDIYVRRTYSGRPSSSMRFSEATAMATSVICRPPVRERSASPITRL